jgi:predicted nucleotidyltransferase
MLEHHAESISIAIEHYKENKDVSALFLLGSVATGENRDNSDLDFVAIVPHEIFLEKKRRHTDCESVFGKCTYEDGYFDTHFMSVKVLREIEANDSEPSRNMFNKAACLFSDNKEIEGLVRAIPTFKNLDVNALQFRQYCTMKQGYRYYLNVTQPQGFARHHYVDLFVNSVYKRLGAHFLEAPNGFYFLSPYSPKTRFLASANFAGAQQL